MKLPLNSSLNFPVTCFVLSASAFMLLPAGAIAATADPGCNQLGREVALRAAEQMQAGLDAAARSELAAIAEGVCLEFTVPATTDVAVAGENKAPAAEAGGERREVLGLEIIPPEERVRRPGLKRP